VTLFRRLGPRFIVEILIVAVVPVATAYAGGSWQVIVVVTIATWLAIAVLERALSRPRVATAGAPAGAEVANVPHVRVLGREEPEPEVAAPEPVLEVEAEPEADFVEPEPEPEPEPLVLAEPEPEPEPEPVVVAAPPPAPEPLPEPEPEPIAAFPLPPPQRWNLWNLERVVREQAGDNEELSFLLMYLREFATADGLLPLDFDVLVRESFGDLLAVGAR
jgi:hypothetical protein